MGKKKRVRARAESCLEFETLLADDQRSFGNAEKGLRSLAKLAMEEGDYDALARIREILVDVKLAREAIASTVKCLKKLPPEARSVIDAAGDGGGAK